MTRRLAAISDSVMHLLDTIEAAGGAPGEAREEPEDPVVRKLARHPLAYAVAMIGVGLLGGHLIARARRRRPADDVRISWWNPPDREGLVH